MEILIVKTGALGDVLRTTSILPGLRARHPDGRVTWLTAEGAVDLVRHHPEVARVVAVDPAGEASLARATADLASVRFERILSFDDEEPLCRLATELGGTGEDGVLSGAYLAADGSRTYTADTAPWFDMGLLSHFGKEEADRRKLANTESHPAIFARMLGIEAGEPALPLPEAALAFAERFAVRQDLAGAGAVVGLNTGAGGRWDAKRLSEERTAELAVEVARGLDGRVTFLLLGGADEAVRNARIVQLLGAAVRLVDAGTGNTLLEFAALVARLDLLVTSDSLALHLGVAAGVPVVAFFAPTSPAEIELYGRGEKVVSTAPDAGSYRPDVDTSTLTAERLAAAVVRVLSRS